MMIRSTSNDDMVNNSAKKGPKKVGSSIGRLESFQRVLGVSACAWAGGGMYANASRSQGIVRWG